MSFARAYDPLDSPIFVQGLHRSGTTLLYEMLAEAGPWNSIWSWHVICFDEIEAGCQDFKESQQKLQSTFDQLHLDYRRDPMKIRPDLKEEYGFVLDNWGLGFRFREASLERLRHALRCIARTQDPSRPTLLKNPWDFSNGPRLQECIPSAKFVYIHRDPVESINSLWDFTRKLILQPWGYLSLLSKRYRRFARSAVTVRMLQTVVRQCPQFLLWAIVQHTVRECRRYLRTIGEIPRSARATLTYDNLCECPNETMAQVLERLELPRCPVDFRRFVHRRKLPLDPLVSKWKARIRHSLSDYSAAVGV